MKKIAILTVIILGLGTLETNAQDYTFRVLATNGHNMVKPQGSKWLILKTGYRLASDDKIKIDENGYLGLVHSSGKTLELKKANTYEVAKLETDIQSNSKSIVSKYADFVVSKMTPEKIEENRRKYASVTGSGERGVYDTEIHLYMPKTTKVLNSSSALTWSYEGEESDFSITIKNILGEELLTTESSTPFYRIDFNDEAIVNGSIMNFITVRVMLKSDASVMSQEIAISLLDGEEKKELDSVLTELVSNLGRNSAISDLVLAQFYEEEGLILDAITSYEDAVSQSPDVEYFQEVYTQFLIRNGLKNPVSPKKY